jgi:hypothetical protein
MQQSKLWQEINDAGKDSNVFVKPSNLDLSQSKFEFYIAPKEHGLISGFFYTLFRITRPEGLFKLCNKESSKSIKVNIEICVQSAKQLKPEITTEPKSKFKPEEMYVTNLTV